MSPTKTKPTHRRTPEELEAEAEKERVAAAEAAYQAEQDRIEKEEARREEVEIVAAAIAGVERDAVVLPGDPLVATFTSAAKAALDALEDHRSSGRDKRRKSIEKLDLVSDVSVPVSEAEGTAHAINPGDGRPTTETVQVAGVGSDA